MTQQTQQSNGSGGSAANSFVDSLPAGLKVAVGVAGGYLLGRTGKTKLAIGLGGLLLGKRVSLDPKALVEDVMKTLRSTPEFEQISNTVRTDVMRAGRSAGAAVLTRQVEQLAELLHTRTEQTRKELEGGSDQDGSTDEESGGERGEAADRQAEESATDPDSRETGQSADDDEEQAEPRAERADAEADDADDEASASHADAEAYPDDPDAPRKKAKPRPSSRGGDAPASRSKRSEQKTGS